LKGEDNMAKSYISESELKEIDGRFAATQELIGKQKWSSNIWNNTLALVEIFNIERLRESSVRLEKISQRLVYLTNVLIGVTIVLIILTCVLVWRSFIH